MTSAWDPILVLFIETILVTACVTGNLEQRYNNNRGKSAKEGPQLTAIMPKSYDALLQLPQNENSISTEDTVMMTAFIGEPTDQIVFHIDNITIVSCEVLNRIDRPIGPYNKKYDLVTGKYEMPLNSTLSTGQIMTIALKYRGVLPGDTIALYRSLDSIKKHHSTNNSDDFNGIVGIGIFGAARYSSTQESAGKYRAYLKDYFAKFGTIAESLESALELAKYEFKCYDDSGNYIIERIRNDDDKDDGAMPKTCAVSIRATEMPENDTRNTTDYRLPDRIEPFAYILKIRLEGETLFHGNVEIKATVMKRTTKIVLHAKEIEVHSIKVMQDAKMFDIASTAKVSRYNFFVINLCQPLAEGLVSIHMDYTGKFDGVVEGFYRSTYMDDTGNKRWFFATRLAPIGARRMFPCFDEPRFRTFFDVSISRPANFKTICSAQLVSSTPDRNGNIVDNYFWDDRVPTYIFSLVIGDFESLVNATKNYKISARPNVVKHAKYALDTTLYWAEYYVGLFRRNNEPRYLSMVALPDLLSRGTKNDGTWVRRESELLHDSENTPITAKQSLSRSISQELIYWLFSVTAAPSSWDHIWLSKGFARFFHYQKPTEKKDYWRFDGEFVVEQLHAALESDARNSTHPMTHEVYSSAEISRTFDDIITTAKSASILRMIEKTFGVLVFRETLWKYCDIRSSMLREPDDLFTALQAAIDESNEKLDFTIKPIMDSWVKQAGYPVVSVKIEGRVAHLEQKRFYSNSDEADTGNGDKWWIPVTWASQSNADFTVTSPQYWLRKKHGAVELNVFNEWVIFNVQQSGYYRVNYDSASWKRIINALKSRDRISIHEINRAALISDLLILGQAGQIDYATALSATQYLINETDYIPWRSAFNSLAYINRQLKGNDNFELYKTHVRTILNPIYEKLGFTEFSGEKLHDTLLRTYVVDWACQFKVESCISWSREKFAAWKLNSIAVPVNLRKTVYCTAIEYGTPDDWNFLWKRYASTSSATEKVVILDGLGCSKLRKNIQRLLFSASTGNLEIRFEDSLRAFSAVYSHSSMGTEYVLDFVTQNLMNIFVYFRGRSTFIDSILSGISSALATKQQLLKMEDFVQTERQRLTEIGLFPDKYLQIVYETASWYERHSPAIYEWLDRTYPSIDYRLPTKIHPRSYDIYLSPYLDLERLYFSGEVIIKVDIIADTFSIVLHAHALSLATIRVFIDSTKVFQISSYTIDKVTDRITIYLTREVVAGTELCLQISFIGESSDDMYGLQWSSYIDKNGKTRLLGSTQFRPVHARRVFPCFDEPAFKATFAIHIERPNDYHTLSNMRRLSSVPSSSNRTWDLYERSVPMSSYLVAFVMSDFESLDNVSGNYGLWAPPGTAKYGEYALDVCEKVLRFLEKYTGIDNPMEKIDLIAIPSAQSGAMANWGLLTFRDDALLGNENVTSASLMKNMLTLVAHGTVDTWFGNLVTCDWWDHVWLQEGLAKYFQWIAGHQVSPSWKLLQQFVVYEMQPAMMRDALSPQSLNSKIVTPSDIAFGYLSHGKSASIIRMIHHTLGKRAFRSALRKFLEERKWKTAKPEHFLSAIQLHTHLGVQIKVIVQSWTNNMGYPVVNAIWDANVLTLAQEQFVFARRNVTADQRINSRFWIPITWTTKSKPNFRDTRPSFWLYDTSEEPLILKKGEWFIINIQEAGFYRVNYDVNSWKRIIAGLMSDDFDGIHEINRAQIIDDLFNLARADYVAYDLALSATPYLIKEDNHLAWAAFFEAIDFLCERFDKHDAGLALYPYVDRLIERVYRKVGFVDLADEQHMDRLNREMILRWACRLGKPDCIASALKLYNTWRQIGTNRISPNARPAVYCTSVLFGGSDNWQFLWNQYARTELGSEKVIILKALACSRNTTILHNYLELAMSSNNSIRDQDIPEIFSAVLHADTVGVDVMLEFLQRNYNELRLHYGGWDGVAKLIHRVASKISHETQLQKLELFIRKTREDLDEIKTSLLSAIDTATTNLEWIRAHETNFTAALMRVIEPINRGEENNSSPILPSNWILVTVVFYLVFAY